MEVSHRNPSGEHHLYLDPMATTAIDTRLLHLRMVRADDLLLHEQTDPERVTRLRNAVINSNVLRNPPIVGIHQEGEGGKETMVVLDGATRTTALRELGVKHIMVQVVDYPGTDVALHAWYHMLGEKAAAAVLDAIPTIAGATCSVVSLEEAQIGLSERRYLAAVVEENDVVHVLECTDDATEPAALRNLVAKYGGYGEIYRIVQGDLIETLQRSQKVPAVVLFPSWSPADIVGFARNADLLPAGITRHVIPGRALNVNVALDLLTIDTPTDAANLWLDQWLTAKIMRKKVRYYHEPVFVFDD